MAFHSKPVALLKRWIPHCAHRVISFFAIVGCGVMSTLASESPAEPAHCVMLHGNPIQGGMLWGQTSATAEIRFGDRRVPVLPGGQFLLVWGEICPRALSW